LVVIELMVRSPLRSLFSCEIGDGWQCKPAQSARIVG
jgi:hypothetical protein